jgi:hypothetical protein
MQDHFWIVQFVDANQTAFIDFWERQYKDTADLEHLYENNISVKPFTTDAIKKLFQWKNGGKLSKEKETSVCQNYVSMKECESVKRAIEFRHGESLSQLTDFANAFLQNEFQTGGAIWRIFWLHCCNQCFPIYDQHVHRAMVLLEEGRIEELGKVPDEKKIDLYLTRYLPFHYCLTGEQRNIDRALYTFGQFIKKWPNFCTQKLPNHQEADM